MYWIHWRLHVNRVRPQVFSIRQPNIATGRTDYIVCFFREMAP